jgi:gluconate 2-dehydrogenase gamma chain
MEKVEAGKVPADLWPGVGAAAFFRLLVDHTMQGFYGSPRHGGNRDYVSYRILVIDYPQVIGRNRPRRT